MPNGATVLWGQTLLPPNEPSWDYRLQFRPFFRTHHKTDIRTETQSTHPPDGSVPEYKTNRILSQQSTPADRTAKHRKARCRNSIKCILKDSLQRIELPTAILTAPVRPSGAPVYGYA